MLKFQIYTNIISFILLFFGIMTVCSQETIEQNTTINYDTVQGSYLRGDYYFRNIKTGQFLDSEPGGKIQLDTPKYNEDVRWRLSFRNEKYSISNTSEENGYIGVNGTVRLGDHTERKEWMVIKTSQDTYVFLDQESDSDLKYLAGIDGNVQKISEIDDTAGHWQLINVKQFSLTSTYLLRNLETGQYLDTREQGNVSLYSEQRGNYSAWRFVPTSNGYIMLDNLEQDRGPVSILENSDTIIYQDEASLSIPLDSYTWKILYHKDNIVQFLNKDPNQGYLTATSQGTVHVDRNFNAERAFWEILPIESIEVTEFYLKNIKTGKYLHVNQDRSLSLVHGDESSKSLWTVAEPQEGFYIIDNSEDHIGPLMCTPYHNDMRIMDERYTTFDYKNRQWAPIQVRENVYKFLSKDFNRGYLTASDSGKIQNLAESEDPGTEWELVKKTENTNTEVVIYPNPATSPFVIDFGLQRIEKVVIYTITGRVIYNKIITGNQNQLVITKQLRSGTYMVQLLKNSGETTTKRLVIL